MNTILACLDANMRYGIRTACAIVLATFVSLFFHFQDPFWAAITAAVVMMPTLGANLERGGSRLIGTFLGGVLGFITAGFVIHSYVLFLLAIFLFVGGALFLSFTTKRPYAYVMLGITAYMILGELVYKHEQIFQITIWRITDITVGVLSAWLVSYFVFPLRSKDIMIKKIRASYGGCVEYFDYVMQLYLQQQPATDNTDYKTILDNLNAAEELIGQSKVELTTTTSEHVMINRMLLSLKRITRQIRNLDSQFQTSQQYQLLNHPKLNIASVIKPIETCLKDLNTLSPNATACISVCHDMLSSIAACTERFHQLREQGIVKQFPVEDAMQAHSFIGNINALAHEIENLMLNMPDEKTIEQQKRIIENTSFFNFSEKEEAIKQSIKGGLSAVLAMVIWVFTDWPGGLQGIVSATIVSAQKNIYDSQLMGELRLLGCLFGGGAGIIALYFIHFNLSTLLLFMFIVCSFFAWLTLKSKTYGYGAIQANFAFILAIVHSPGPATELSAPLERVAGIVLGITAAMIVAKFLWPTHPKRLLNRGILDALTKIKTMSHALCQQKITDQDKNIQDRIAINTLIKRNRTLLNTIQVYHHEEHDYVITAQKNLNLLSELVTNLYSMIDNIDYEKAKTSAETYHLSLQQLLDETNTCIEQLNLEENKILFPKSSTNQLETLKSHLKQSLQQIRQQARTQGTPTREITHLFKFLNDSQQLLNLLLNKS